MIIKVKQGDSAEGLLEYQRRGKGTRKSRKEQAGVRVFATQGIHNVENAGAVLDRLATKSGRKNAIVHLIIRAERGLSDPEWNTAMSAVLGEAGLSTTGGLPSFTIMTTMTQATICILQRLRWVLREIRRRDFCGQNRSTAA